MAHVSLRLEEAVRDADPVVVTTSSNVQGGRGKIDGLPETKASCLPLPDLVGVLPILLENPESRSICVRDRKISDFDSCSEIFK